MHTLLYMTAVVAEQVISSFSEESLDTIANNNTTQQDSVTM